MADFVERYNTDRCPNCGGTKISVPVETWMVFEEGQPHHYNDE